MDLDTPAPSTSDVGPKRGRKRSAAVADEAEVVEDLSDDPTPRKGKRAPTFSVVIDSPPIARAKQRIRANEAGDAIDVPERWVGRGEVSVTK
jgi:hypothetical protein